MSKHPSRVESPHREKGGSAGSGAKHAPTECCRALQRILLRAVTVPSNNSRVPRQYRTICASSFGPCGPAGLWCKLCLPPLSARVSLQGLGTQCYQHTVVLCSNRGRCKYQVQAFLPRMVESQTCGCFQRSSDVCRGMPGSASCQRVVCDI